MVSRRYTFYPAIRRVDFGVTRFDFLDFDSVAVELRILRPNRMASSKSGSSLNIPAMASQLSWLLRSVGRACSWSFFTCPSSSDTRLVSSAMVMFTFPSLTTIINDFPSRMLFFRIARHQSLRAILRNALSNPSRQARMLRKVQRGPFTVSLIEVTPKPPIYHLKAA